MSRRSTAIALAQRPHGEPCTEDFQFLDLDLPSLSAGEVLVQNEWISVDPYMRRRMNEGPSYVPAFELGKPMDGGAVGRVLESADPNIEAGQWVTHNYGWRDRVVMRAREARAIDPTSVSPSAFLGVLGMPGLTAWVGLTEIAGLTGEDIVFVSGAAGAVGSLVGQIAKERGHRVVGSAGSADKIAWLTEKAGFDVAFNYRDGDVTTLLREAAPDGIDVYFDNVGYDHLEAALAVARNRSRFAMCGTVADYNETGRVAGPSNMFEIVSKRISMRGFIATDHFSRFRDFQAEVEPLLSSGTIIYQETVVDGLENAPDAFISLLNGKNMGKMLVRIES